MTKRERQMFQAHRLAHELEYGRAKEAARVARMPGLRNKWETFFDPHAATELGNLIFKRVVEAT